MVLALLLAQAVANATVHPFFDYTSDSLAAAYRAGVQSAKKGIKIYDLHES